MATRRKRKPRIRHCHMFVPDEDIGADWRGTRTCANCGHLGWEGDARHPVRPAVMGPPPPIPDALAAAYRAYDAARTGEHDDEGDL